MSIDLKSLLNTYEFSCELPSDSRTITFRPFTTGQMKKMLVHESSKSPFIIEQILDDVINDCVTTPDFSVDDILLQDRFYLLLKIREHSKGDTYQYNWRCPECKTDNVGAVKISSMVVTPMNIDTTPIPLNDKLSVTMKLITRGEQKQIYTLLDKTKLTVQQKMVEAATMSIACSLDTFISGEERDDKVTFEEKVNVVNNFISAQTFELLKEWIVDNDFGIKFEIALTCMNEECEKQEVYSIPLDRFFN